MSAKFESRDGFVYLPDPTTLELAVLESQFDNIADYDIEEIKHLIEEEKLHRKVALIKILISPIELFLVFIILRKEMAVKKRVLSLMWRFYRKKITFEVYTKELIKLAKEANI